jgi:hypothetical protein
MEEVDQSFRAWLEKLINYANECGFKGNIVEQTGEDCWLGYYEDDYTPEEAYTEDCSY